MIPESTPLEIRAGLQFAQVLLWTTPADAFADAYYAEHLIFAVDRMRVEQGQCPPALRRN